ncbi:hypothetical protein [Tissierella sp. Yu-01]|uniref:hypothetical protein n=1 Tax=Tissierella sp. Yu-01 TaxID=3035694 RepID=UPI00240DD2BD|nr:hypothetical protein [Tissierella sp. Yu-01]WFA08086.1 hypothetical protein P3962_10135 [Tissierella sp. Yu-01]
MSTNTYKKLEIILPSEIVDRLYEIAIKEKRPINQQIALIIAKYLKEYNKILEVTSEQDFGTITEEKLREFLSKEENQIEYKYENIKDYTFDELFQFWLDKFMEN